MVLLERGYLLSLSLSGERPTNGHKQKVRVKVPRIGANKNCSLCFMI